MAAGYSNTPLAKKLGIKAHHRVAVLHEPEEFRRLLGDLDAVEVCAISDVWSGLEVVWRKEHRH